jgi:hypothetical protein
MSIRERIMALKESYRIKRPLIHEDALRIASNLATARERELLDTLTESSKHEAMLENRVMQLLLQREGLLAQRDELLAALGNIREYWNRDRNDDAMHDALWHIIEVADTAIAKAEGGGA